MAEASKSNTNLVIGAVVVVLVICVSLWLTFNRAGGSLHVSPKTALGDPATSPAAPTTAAATVNVAEAGTAPVKESDPDEAPKEASKDETVKGEAKDEAGEAPGQPEDGNPETGTTADGENGVKAAEEPKEEGTTE
eukprot:TRINITY_DN12432_c0_g1_i1.p2 TRINITY_DN12432_c0_g1~~TRINITY_DN12432_c0_g1_i1.p2  ORF type:complete len:136 (+),score=24.32 TRINITY_DN12432_c0_g1_i1:59-466(+)